MILRKFRKKINEQEGYTLVETLVAGALLIGVLIPALLFLGRISAKQTDCDRLIAMQLAREAIEKTTALSVYSDMEETIVLQQRAWQILREVHISNDLAEVMITVNRLPSKRTMIRLKTLKYL